VTQETVTVEAGPGGVKGSVTGSQVLPALLAMLLGAWVWYLVIYVQDAKSAEREKFRVVAIEEQTKAVKELAKAVERQEETLKALVYIQTMPQKEKERLNLVRPKVLYEMQGYPRER
jgi:hypothetical protein